MDSLLEELEQTTTAAPKGRQTTLSQPPKPKTRLWIVGGLVLAAAAGTGVYAHFRGRVSTDDAQVDAHIAPIAPKISGSVAEILVDDNQAVKAGQVLLRIDPRDDQAKVDQARAALAAAESQAVGAREGVPLTNATTASSSAAAEAQLAAANADYERAKADYERASSSELAYAGADVDAKRATADRARADLERMEPLAAKDEISKLQLDAYVAATRVAD